jgi:phosphotriesterase-related protein
MDDGRRIEIEEDYGLPEGVTFEPGDDGDDADEAFDLTKPHVMTVLGPVEPAALGVVLPQEHLIHGPEATSQDDPDHVLDDPHATLAEVEDFHASGGGALVDVATAATGRDIHALRWIAARAPVHIIATTGGATEFKAAMSPAELTSHLVTELRKGIDGTAARAGVIRFGASSIPDLRTRQALAQAVALTSQETGAAVAFAAAEVSAVIDTIDLLRAEGVAPHRLLAEFPPISDDDDLFHRLLETGVFCTLTPGAGRDISDPGSLTKRIRTVIAWGYRDQLLVSLGFGRKSRLRAYGGQPGWVYLLERFTLELMEAGLDAMTIRQLLIANPQRALTIQRETTG